MPETQLTGDDPGAADRAFDRDFDETPDHGHDSRTPERTAGQRLWHDFWRPSRTQGLLAVAVFLVAVTTVVTARVHNSDSAYSGMRRADLVQLLDTLNTQQGRLQDEITSLNRTLDQLTSADDAARAAADANQQRLDTLRLLAGTVAAQGPGVRLTINDPQLKVTPEMLVECVQELRDAGAEAIQVNGQVRVVASTWFDADGTDLVADGVALARPIVIEAIGDPSTLVSALQFRGGVVSTVQGSGVGGSALVIEQRVVKVTALHRTTPLRHAKPK